MQTFLPLPSFEESLRCLDTKRLGKQRVEAKQLVDVLGYWDNPQNFEKAPGWVNHPAALMWRGYKPALMRYANQAILLWIERGYQNTMGLYVVKDSHAVAYPPWFGDPAFHASHRAALLSKNLSWYSQFGWSESPEYNYVWPSAA